jgi:quercetin dioxygenase-like cupin family protein
LGEAQMKKTLLMVAMLGLASAALVTGSRVLAKGSSGASALLIPVGQLKFVDVPEYKGLQMAQVEGDPAKGPSHFLIKFTPGFKAPLHHHTANHYATVVAGTLVLTVDGKETKLPPGSFFSFTDKQPHVTMCEAGAECIVSLDVRGKWDVVPEKTAQK